MEVARASETPRARRLGALSVVARYATRIARYSTQERLPRLPWLRHWLIQSCGHWRRWTRLRGRHGGSTKMFLASALVILVFAGVSVVSLSAVGRLVSVNRDITVSTIPALTVTASTRDAMPRLVALEARTLVLGDGQYARTWTQRR